MRECWNPESEQYEQIPGQEERIALSWLPESSVVWSNAGTTIQDLGDGILNIAFHTKMNSIGSEVLEGLNKVIDLAENDEKWNGVVVSNEGAQFSAGANVGMIFMLAVEQEWDDLNYAVQLFQRTMMRMRYSGIPWLPLRIKWHWAAVASSACIPTRSLPTPKPIWAWWNLELASSRQAAAPKNLSFD